MHERVRMRGRGRRLFASLPPAAADNHQGKLIYKAVSPTTAVGTVYPGNKSPSRVGFGILSIDVVNFVFVNE